MTEQISAFVDGEMGRERLEKNIKKMLSDKHAMQAYHDYQRIGDAMRGELYQTEKPDLTSQIMASIDAEPTVLSPNAIQPATPMSATVSVKRPQVWSIAASVAAVVAVGLLTWQQQSVQDNVFGTTLAATASPVVPTQTVIKQYAKVNNIPQHYLEAHHVSAPSVGSHYIQSASYAE